jgi:hypothetical protein
MHPTANSVAFMRETPANQRLVAAGDAGRHAAKKDSAYGKKIISIVSAKTTVYVAW